MNSVAQYQKPIMISETGALANYQSTYFPQITSTLESSYPLVKAISYFDTGAEGGNWSLTSDGEAAFAAMGQQQYFSAMPSL
ncbi:MAG: hypothetical protein IAI50_11010 [Candidatus Eremiobacteraeota bacterium]|nr:hypothetical protein [Candidatus Eremiobacteraeota bacterium]